MISEVKLLIDINNSFLNSKSTILPNEAEFTILTSLYFDEQLQKKSFILVIDKLDDLLSLKNQIHKEISSNFSNDSLNIFSLKSQKITNEKTPLIVDSNSSHLKNQALEKSNEDCAGVYCQTNNGVEYFINGNTDPNFQYFFEEKKKSHEENLNKYDLCNLPMVLQKYQALRKIEKPDVFLKEGTDKINSSLSEQDFRNDLWEFLREHMKGVVTKEENTYSKDDEESVDLAIRNKDNQMTIIEVKFIIQRKYFDIDSKDGYSHYRFGDGYLQLNKYCDHLGADEQEIYQTYLYMFYAHDNPEKIKEKCNEYYEKVSKGEYKDSKQIYRKFPNFCNGFRNSYRGTFLDNLLERFDYLIVNGSN